MLFDASELYGLAADVGTGVQRVAVASAVVVNKTTTATAHTAKDLVAVDTGELRDSIRVSAHGLTGEVTADAGHASFVEEGTSVMAPQPFMSPALARHESEFVVGLTNVAEQSFL